MVYVDSALESDLPVELSDHMARTWCLDTPFEPNLIVISENGDITKLDGHGNWFLGRHRSLKT